MRSNNYSEVRQWAPFMLIGDNVKFDFGKTATLIGMLIQLKEKI